MARGRVEEGVWLPAIEHDHDDPNLRHFRHNRASVGRERGLNAAKGRLENAQVFAQIRWKARRLTRVSGITSVVKS